MKKSLKQSNVEKNKWQKKNWLYTFKKIKPLTHIINKKINLRWVIDIYVIYIAYLNNEKLIKRNKLLIHRTISVNLKTIMLNERGLLSQESTYCMIPLIWSFRIGKTNLWKKSEHCLWRRCGWDMTGNEALGKFMEWWQCSIFW